MTTKIKWTLLAIVLLQLTIAKSQNSRSYDTGEWIPIAKTPNDDAAPQKKPSGRVLNLADNTNKKNYLLEEKRTKNKPVVEQYLRETTQVAPQKDYVRQPVRFQENARPKVQEQPKYYLIPKQREHLYLQQQEQQHHRQQLLSPQFNTETYLNQQPLQNPYDPNSYFVPPTPPLNISLSPYQPLRPDTINQELIAALSKPASVQVISTTPRPKEEKPTVQLLYVPVETLTKKEQPKVEAQHNWNEETRREPQYLPQHRYRLQGIQTDFAKQALEAHRLQMQLQAGSVPVVYTTTPKPKRRKPHQPPLSLYMGANHDVDISDVLEELKHADTIAVQDNVGPDTPKVFVGPSNLDVPNSFAKFELPYLNSIDNNRIERKVEHLPFFVAPQSYRAPPGYSKIPLPSPHVGSVVVSTKATHDVTSKKPKVVEEEEDDSSEDKSLYKFVPKYNESPQKSEVDDEINRRLEQTESLFENQASKRQPVSLTVRSRTTTSTNPDHNSEQTKSTTQAPRHVDARPTKAYSSEEPQNVRITTEHVRSSRPRTYTFSFEEPEEVHATSERPSKPRTYQQEEQQERVTSARPSRPKTYSFEEPQEVYATSERPSRARTYQNEEQEERVTSVRPSRPVTYSFEEPQEVHATSERPSRARTYQQEEHEERVTSVRPSRPKTYSFEEPQDIRVTSQRPSAPRTYSFEEPQPVGESTENPRHSPSRSKQYSTEEEPERKPQIYRQNHREEDDEEVTRRQPQRTSYPTTERVRFVEDESTQKEESEVTYRKPPRENHSGEESDEEPPRRKPSRTRERVESDDAPPRRQSSEEETVRSSAQPRYEASVKRPVEHSSEERDDDDSEVRERPTKVTYTDTLYQSTPHRQNSYDEPKQPYQTSNRFASTTPVYIVRTTEDDSERPAYYSPTPTSYAQSYRTEEEYNVGTSTPHYTLQREEEPQVYSVSTARPEQVSPTSQEQSYEAKFAPYLNLDVHVKAPGLHESSIYDLTDKKANGPNPYEQQSSKSSNGNREGYSLPSHLPEINPEIPGLINNLQDQSIRQLLVPGLLVPTTEHLPEYKRPETTTPEYTSVTRLAYTTTTPEPIIETTTLKRTRSRQRGGSRFSASNNRDSGEVTSPPRRASQRSRRPQTRQRNEHRREEHEHTTEYSPVRASHDYTTTEASRRDITHSPRQRVRSRRPQHRESQEETRQVEETPRTTQPTPPPPAPQSYIQFDRDQSTENILQRSGLDHPVTELRDYHQVYNLPLQETSATSKEDSRPEVDVHVTHPQEHTTQQQYQSPRTRASSSEETETARHHYEEVTTTPKPRSRQRTRGRARVVSSTPAATRKSTITTTTTKPQTKEKEEEFYGFIRPPSFNKPNPPKPTEVPAYTDFDKRFKIPSYSFDFPSYHYPSSQNHDDYYKELEAAGREPIQLYTNDKHLSTTPLYVYKPKFVAQTEEQEKLPATDDPLRHIKEEAREKTRLRVRGPQRRKPDEEGIRREGSRHNEVSTEARTDSKTARARGRTHFQLPASLRTASEEEVIQGGNYPAEFLQKQASVTQPTVFQITVEPQTQDAEYDQQPFSSIQRPSIALPDEPNALAKGEKSQLDEITSTVQPTAEETATTLPPTETTTEVEKKNGRRRGVWKLVKQRPLDNFETAESQNYRTALQLTAQSEDTKKDNASLLDTLYEMFSSPEKDEASTEATTASAQTQVGNNTSSEEVITTTAVPETEATTVTADEATTISETGTTEAAAGAETATEKVLKPYEVEPWEMKAVKTSTTTEVSHETEICFRGRCVKSSGIAETP